MHHASLHRVCDVLHTIDDSPPLSYSPGSAVWVHNGPGSVYRPTPAPVPPLEDGAEHDGPDSDEDQEPPGEVGGVWKIPHLLPHQDGSE